MNRRFLLRDPFSRRTFIERCALQAFGLSLLPQLTAGSLAAAETPSPAKPGFGRAKRVIWIRLAGGLSHIDTFDPKTGRSQGPGKAVSTKAGFQITDYLPRTAAMADKLCVIRSMTANVGVHTPAQYLMRTGNEQRGTIVHPALGPWCRHFLGPSSDTLPSSVCVNVAPDRGNGFFPASYSPLPVLDPTAGLQHVQAAGGDELLKKRLTLSDELDRDFRQRFDDPNVKAYTDFYDETVRLMRSRDLRAFDLTLETEPMRESYGKDSFGQGCLLARRLIEANVRFVEVEFPGWDMHYNLEDEMESLAPQFDKTFTALLGDLDARGLLDSTLVAVTTEFGRKPQFDGGRGHHPPAFSTVLVGGGVKRGYVYGATDETGGEVVDKPLTVAGFHATIGWAVGVPLDKAFVASNGRPFTVGNNEAPALDVFA